MRKETMSSHERWEAVLQHKKPDRLPMDYRATDEATQKFKVFTGIDDFEEIIKLFHIDMPVKLVPDYTGPGFGDDGDVFGCRYANIPYDGGLYRECIYHPLEKYRTKTDIESDYRWPSPDWWDYSNLWRQIRGKEGRPVHGGGSEPFLIYCKLRGLEQGMMDLMLNPEMVHYCLDKLYGLAYEDTRRIYEAMPGKVLITFVAEDMGSQEDLLFSLNHIQEYFFPRMKRMMELVHQAGAYVFTHSDGAVRSLIPHLIEIGMDVLDPVQWRSKGMDRTALMQDFGDKILFHGGIDNQETLPFGTEEDVREEVMKNIEIFGKRGGYIIGPCHNIQAVSPAENIAAIYETAYEYGWMD